MDRFFARPGEYPPCGMYTAGHLLFLAGVFAAISLALWLTRRNDGSRTVLRLTRVMTAVLWLLEIVKILFNLTVVGVRDFNEYIPLYFCSMILYAGAFSSLGRGWVKRTGDVFIATGAIIGGLFFLLYPSTSLTKYPAMHFLCWHSMLLHGSMVFLGLKYLLSGYCRPALRDLGYYAGLVTSLCCVATVFNEVTGANLMFISRDFPGPPLSLLYNAMPRPCFTLLLSAGQATIPFLMVYGANIAVRRLLRLDKGEKM